MIVALVLMAALLVVDLNYIRRSRKLAKELGLPQGQWLRPVKTLLFDPTIEVLVVGCCWAATWSRTGSTSWWPSSARS
ncbi:MAG: hypothetical protein H6528_06640 [Actinobacteria bacterium]|nr:hypothetical protein [Actinomycetota bacterium]